MAEATNSVTDLPDWREEASQRVVAGLSKGQAADAPRAGGWEKMHTGSGGLGENKKRGFKTPLLIILPNINSEAGQALDH